MTRSVLGRVMCCVLLLGVVGCASIPRASSVHRISDGQDGSQIPSRYEPAGPADDATPSEIVRGYLDAMLAYPANLATVKKFLTEEAAEKWKPGASTLIYSNASVQTSDSGLASNTGPNTRSNTRSNTGPNTGRDGSADNWAEVAADVSVWASLDRDGHFSSADGRRDLGFELEKVDGRWRISSAPPGTLISKKYFSDYFRSFNLYFVNADGKRLWAEPVHVSVGEQTATELVKILLRGPRKAIKKRAMKKYAHTQLPESATLNTSIPVDADGVAEVSLNADLASLDNAQRNAMAAQLTWTLSQVPNIDRIRISGTGGVIAPRGDRQQEVKAWQSFDPVQHSPVSYAVTRGVVRKLSGTSSSAVDGVWGEQKHQIDNVSVAGSTIAVLHDDRVRIGKISGSRTTSITGSSITAIEADASGSVLVAGGDDGGSQIVSHRNDTSRTVAKSEEVIDRLSLSPDGARYAVVTGRNGKRAVATGLVARDDEGRITALEPPHAVNSSAGVQAAAWLSPTTLLLATGGQVGASLEQRTVDGAPVSDGDYSATVPADTIQRLSVGTNRTVYALDDAQQLWALRDGASWRSVEGRYNDLSTGF